MLVLLFIENVWDSRPSQKPDNGACFSVDVQQTEPIRLMGRGYTQASHPLRKKVC